MREAKKHFWSYPNAWSCVDVRWLRAGGFSGDTLHDVDFLACVEQVDIDISCILNFHSWVRPEDVKRYEGLDSDDNVFANAPSAVVQSVKEQIRNFWRTLQRLCPRVTRVIASYSR